MASIAIDIELTDGLSAPLLQITSALDQLVSSILDVRSACEADIGIASLVGIIEEANNAAAAFLQKIPQQNIPEQENLEPAQSPALLMKIPPKQQDNNGIEEIQCAGIEEYQEELQSLNNLMDLVNQSQAVIDSTAKGMELVPDAVTAELENIQTEAEAVGNAVEQLEANPLDGLTDGAADDMELLKGQLQQAVTEQGQLTSAMENMDISEVNEDYNRLNSSVDQTQSNIQDNVTSQKEYNESIEDGAKEAEGLKDKIMSAASEYLSMDNLKMVLEFSDTLTQSMTRLNTMNDGLQSTEELQNMIYSAAERSRTSYSDMSDMVTQLGGAGDVFGSNAETIQFAENLNKVFVAAGASQDDISAASEQLAEALGSGVIQGEELNAVFGAAPAGIQTIADSLGVSVEEVNQMANDGQITADIIKNAMIGATDEINANLESVPKTFGQISTNIHDGAMNAFQPLLEQINEIANSEAFGILIDGIINGFVILSGVAMSVFNLVKQVVEVIGDNWSIISPLIIGAAFALGLYMAAVIAMNAAEMISNVIKAIAAFQAKTHSTSLLAEMGSTIKATAAQWGLNSAILACPITWIILAIIAVIAIIYAVVAAINKFQNKTISATGIICGAFAWVGALVANTFITAANFIIDAIVGLWNFIASFANFFANVFNDPIGSIARLFFDLVDTILSLFQAVAGVADTFSGSNFSGGVQKWRDELSGWVDGKFGEEEEIVKKINSEDLHIERRDLTDSYDAGYNFGQGIDEQVSNFDPKSLLEGNNDAINPDDYLNDKTGGNEIQDGLEGIDSTNYDTGYNPDFGSNGSNYSSPPPLDNTGNIPDSNEFTSEMEGVNSGVDQIASDTGDIKDSLEISNESLKFLLDLAAQKVINRFTTAEIKIDMKNENKISKDMDIDGIVTRLEGKLHESMAIAAEGQHM